MGNKLAYFHVVSQKRFYYCSNCG